MPQNSEKLISFSFERFFTVLLLFLSGHPLASLVFCLDPLSFFETSNCFLNFLGLPFFCTVRSPVHNNHLLDKFASNKFNAVPTKKVNKHKKVRRTTSQAKALVMLLTVNYGIVEDHKTCKKKKVEGGKTFPLILPFLASCVCSFFCDSD